MGAAPGPITAPRLPVLWPRSAARIPTPALPSVLPARSWLRTMAAAHGSLGTLEMTFFSASAARVRRPALRWAKTERSSGLGTGATRGLDRRRGRTGAYLG